MTEWLFLMVVGGWLGLGAGYVVAGARLFVSLAIRISLVVGTVALWCQVGPPLAKAINAAIGGGS